MTDVVFTHPHFDRIGWAVVDGRPVFPRATYRARRADRQYRVVPRRAVTTAEAGEADAQLLSDVMKGRFGQTMPR
ncbi:hypothetical protein [Microbispora sp. NPDC046933]|uniref:hypothetical protein n=1 Tax=Microbispora sp. NPDC046933 TaxID=3155618 RepID=UPI0033D77274